MFRPLEDVKIEEGTVVEVHVPVEQQAALNRTSVKDLPLHGIWKDRADISDRLDFVNKLRGKLIDTDVLIHLSRANADSANCLIRPGIRRSRS